MTFTFSELRRLLSLELHLGNAGENEMMLNRFVIGSIATAYTVLLIFTGTVQDLRLPLVCTAYFVGSGILLLLGLRSPAMSEPRRMYACILDTGFLSMALLIGGEVSAPFYPVYLWIILGNGFRFGVQWLRIACVASVLGFSIVVFCTAYWAQHQLLGLGLLFGLIAIPLYCQRLIQKLSTAKVQAEQANAAKTLFLASVSHELRTPLNAVIGMTELLFSTPLTSSQREMSGTVRDAAASLLSLIDDLLSLTRVEGGRTPIAAVPFDLPQLIRDVLAIVSVQATAKGLHLQHHITVRTPLDVFGDPRHLREILLNLLTNSVKFTAAGGITIAVDATMALNNFEFRFEVTDTGIGIHPSAHAKIFDDFSQADETIMNRFGGTGLGLAIARRLTALLGGTIGVTSTPGSGSTFTVLLPMSTSTASVHGDARGMADVVVAVGAADAAELEPMIEQIRALGCTVTKHSVVAEPGTSNSRLVVAMSGSPHTALAGNAGQNAAHAINVQAHSGGLPAHAVRRQCATIVSEDATPAELLSALRIARPPAPADIDSTNEVWVRARPFRVLVADDNQVNQRVISMMLERSGHSVKSVANGEEALDELQSNPFDIVLMDLNMPVMGGIEATKLYRFGSLGGPSVPIVGLTADVTSNIQALCIAAGMDECLSKPINAKQLLDSLDGHLAGRKTILEPAPRAESRPEHSPVPIHSHPRYRLSTSAAVDPAVLEQLWLLGGAEFLSELIDDFEADAGRLKQALQASVAAQAVDETAFHAHALLSAAANMGAPAVQALCHDLQAMAGSDLASRGGKVVGDLVYELGRVSACLARRRLPPERKLAVAAQT